MRARIVLLPGDGVGPEVVAEAQQVLQAVADLGDHQFRFEKHLLGGIAMDDTGDPLPEATLKATKAADAILLGAVGGPKWDDPTAAKRPEQGLLGLRKALSLYANLRPMQIFPGLEHASPLRPELLEDVDILTVRELTGGIYFGEPRGRDERDGEARAFDTMVYTESEIRRVVELAMRLAKDRRRKVISVDKANVLESSRLWRQVATRVGEGHPDIELEHRLVDSAAMQLITSPAEFDVIVTANMFGDILTDEVSVLSGSLGLLPSASLGEGRLGLYEPIHGSAPTIAGQGIANPLGTILSAAMLLRHSLRLEQEASWVEMAVSAVLSQGLGTPDLGGKASTRDVGDAVRAAIQSFEGEPVA